MGREWSSLRVFMSGKEHRYNRKQHLKEPVWTPGSSLSLITAIFSFPPVQGEADPRASLSPPLHQPPPPAKGLRQLLPGTPALLPALALSCRFILSLAFSRCFKIYRTLNSLGKIYQRFITGPSAINTFGKLGECLLVTTPQEFQNLLLKYFAAYCCHVAPSMRYPQSTS